METEGKGVEQFKATSATLAQDNHIKRGAISFWECLWQNVGLMAMGVTLRE